jgi:hypothetical protein
MWNEQFQLKNEQFTVGEQAWGWIPILHSWDIITKCDHTVHISYANMHNQIGHFEFGNYKIDFSLNFVKSTGEWREPILICLYTG